MTTSNTTMEKAEGQPEEGAEAAVTMMSQAEYNDTLESHQALVLTKTAELTQLSEALKGVRESKEPLTKVKNTLQEEINSCNKAINDISEEVTHLKQKLRYHSVRQIHDNIERLQYQLRNNNYKPREEQKILDEISMLQRSVRTLREYEAKQAENKKYRAERTRLIEERNNNYSKIRALYVQEDELKKQIATVRGEISNSRKSIDQLRQLRPKLEQEWLVQQHKLHAARNKRYEEKKRQRQEQIRERQEERRKLWEEYVASREPYEEEKNLCRVLISYLQSSITGSSTTPCTPASTTSHPSGSSTPSITPATTPSLHSRAPSEFPSLTSPMRHPSEATRDTSMVPPESSGTYYSKPKDEEDGFVRVTKRGKAKARREQRLASRTKELRHTPDVLLKFSKLSILPPKNTDQVAGAIVSLQDQLQRFHSLSMIERSSSETGGHLENAKKGQSGGKCCRPKSLAVKSSSCPTTSTQQDTEGAKDNIPIPLSTITTTATTTVHCLTSPATSTTSLSITSPTNLSSITTTTAVHHHPTSPSSVPAIKVASPTVSWPSSFVPNHVSTSNLKQANDNMNNNNYDTETPVAYNCVPLLVNGVVPDVSSVSDLQLCTDILSSGNNDSFFSVPISYTSNLVEAKGTLEPNNNTGFSYAAITANVKPASVDF